MFQRYLLTPPPRTSQPARDKSRSLPTSAIINTNYRRQLQNFGKFFFRKIKRKHFLIVKNFEKFKLHFGFLNDVNQWWSSGEDGHKRRLKPSEKNPAIIIFFVFIFNFNRVKQSLSLATATTTPKPDRQQGGHALTNLIPTKMDLL